MPVPKKQPTTLSPEGSTSESASNTIPEQEEFRQYLRRLAVSAVQVLIEQVGKERSMCLRYVLPGQTRCMHVPPHANANWISSPSFRPFATRLLDSGAGKIYHPL